MLPSETLATVVCSYAMEPRDIAAALDFIGIRLGVRFQGVIVANGSYIHDVGSERWRVLKGSNTELEFSAYQEGVEALLASQAHELTSVLVLNDTTFLNHHASAILGQLLKYRRPLEECRLPAMAGKADPYDNICYRSPWSGLPIYLSTFCFLLNRLAVPALAKALSEADSDLGTSDLDIDSPEWAPHLDAPFKTYLHSHLSYEGISTSWYKLKERRGNRLLISRKARAVYFEHRLSGEIGATGIVFNCYPAWRSKLAFFLREQQAKLVRKLLGHRRSSRVMT